MVSPHCRPCWAVRSSSPMNGAAPQALPTSDSIGFSMVFLPRNGQGRRVGLGLDTEGPGDQMMFMVAARACHPVYTRHPPSRCGWQPEPCDGGHQGVGLVAQGLTGRSRFLHQRHVQLGGAVELLLSRLGAEAVSDQHRDGHLGSCAKVDPVLTAMAWLSGHQT
jgi:hypothetical protein